MRIERGPRLGLAGAALARRARLPGSLDRRTPHRTLGAASGARPDPGAGVFADQEYPPRPRRLPLALSPSGRAGEPRRHARSPLRRQAELWRRRLGSAQRLGDVQRRRHVRPEPRYDPRGAGDHPENVDAGCAVDASRQVLDGDKTRRHVRFPQTPHQAVAGAASADRRCRPLQGLGHAEARRRARLHSDEPQSQSGLCRQPLGIRRDRCCQNRAQAEPPGLAAGARGVRRRHRRGGVETVGRRHDGPHDGRVFSAAARSLRLQGLSQAFARRARQRRHRRLLRQAQLDRRLARHRHRQNRKNLPRGRRLRHVVGVRLRLLNRAA
jgi:hypothetical protein